MTLYTHIDMPGTFGELGHKPEGEAWSRREVRLPDGTGYPRSWFRTASSQQIAEAGFRVYEAPPPPEPEPPTVEQRKAALKEKVKAHGHSIRRQGYSHNFGTDEDPNWQVLQCREPTPENDDEKNWLSSLSAYTTMVMIGQGAIAGAKFKVESNETFITTYEVGMTILLQMQGWAAELFEVSWAKQDAIDAAETHSDLDAIEADIENGWTI